MEDVLPIERAVEQRVEALVILGPKPGTRAAQE
jgi:hypothetical protein